MTDGKRVSDGEGSVSRSNGSGSGGTAIHHFAAGHLAAEGHFPGNPIIPGAVLLREVIAAIAEAAGGGSWCEIRSAKFHHPVHPGNTLVVSWEGAGDWVRFTGSIEGAGRPAVSGELRLVPP